MDRIKTVCVDKYSLTIDYSTAIFLFENAREEDPPAILLESVTSCATIHVRYHDVRLTTIC